MTQNNVVIVSENEHETPILSPKGHPKTNVLPAITGGLNPYIPDQKELILKFFLWSF